MTITGADFSAVLDAIVAKVAAAGIHASRDPGDFQPPGAIVSARSALSDVAVPRTSMVTMRAALLARLHHPLVEHRVAPCRVRGGAPVFGESSAEPVPWISPINPNGLPAMVATVHANVSTTERIRPWLLLIAGSAPAP
jgi:hypothetical protein